MALPTVATIYSTFLHSLSPATHWAVLINTNGCHGCEELNSRSAKRVRNATNFATRLRSARADIQRPFRGVKNAPFFIAFKDLLALVDLERSQKVDLGTCRSQGPNPSLSLEGKPLRRLRIGVWTDIYLWEITVSTTTHSSSRLIIVRRRPWRRPWLKKSNNETRTVFDALSHCTLWFDCAWQHCPQKGTYPLAWGRPNGFLTLGSWCFWPM